jgi:hypothetical protein
MFDTWKIDIGLYLSRMFVFPTDESPITAIFAKASNCYLVLFLFSVLEFFISKIINIDWFRNIINQWKTY